jgi:hypothetical protein
MLPGCCLGDGGISEEPNKFRIGHFLLLRGQLAILGYGVFKSMDVGPLSGLSRLIVVWLTL